MPCPGEDWTTVMLPGLPSWPYSARATMGYSGTSSCRTVNTKALPFIGKKSNSKHPFLPHSEDGYGFRAPTQRRSSSRFIAPPKGIHFFPSIFFPTDPFSCTNLCLPTFPPSIPCLSAPPVIFTLSFFLFPANSPLQPIENDLNMG